MVSGTGGARTRTGSGAGIDLRDGGDATETTVPSGIGSFQLLIKALMRAVSTSDVAAAVASYGTAAVGAQWARVVLLDRTGSPAVSFGGDQDPFDIDERVDPPRHWTEAIHRRAPLEFASPQDFFAAYPETDGVRLLPGRGAITTVPLLASGHCCGAVMFGFDEPGSLTDPVRTVIGEVAALTAYAAERAEVYDAENRAAETLQHAYLPDRLADLCGLTFASRCLSASEPWGVAGDWYDVLPLPGPLVGMVMGDVAGHGMPAATTMAALRGAVRAFSTVDASPAAILARMNKYMGYYKPDAFATLVIVVFDPASGWLRFARAGHPPAVIVDGDGGSVLLNEPFGPPLGVPDASFDEGEILLPVGATLLLYTDGLVERRNENIEGSIASLARTVSRQQVRQPEQLCDVLVEGLAGADLTDDVSLLVVVRRDGTGDDPNHG